MSQTEAVQSAPVSKPDNTNKMRPSEDGAIFVGDVVCEVPTEEHIISSRKVISKRNEKSQAVPYQPVKMNKYKPANNYGYSNGGIDWAAPSEEAIRKFNDLPIVKLIQGRLPPLELDGDEDFRANENLLLDDKYDDGYTIIDGKFAFLDSK